RSCLERGDHVAVTQYQLEEIIGSCNLALDGEGRLYAVGDPEREQRVADEMWTEVVQQSRAWTRNLAPAVAHLRAISIDAGFEQNDAPGEIPANRFLDCEEVTIP